MPPRLDPLIAAVVAKIPGAGATREQRIAWLRMIAMAMDNVHGTVGEPIDIPEFIEPRPSAHHSQQAPYMAGYDSVAAPDGNKVVVVPPGMAPLLPAAGVTRPQPVLRAVDPPRFYIDRDGIARRDPGAVPANFAEAPREIWYDDRGEGDLGAIQWADGTRGVLGKQIEISAAVPMKKKAG